MRPALNECAAQSSLAMMGMTALVAAVLVAMAVMMAIATMVMWWPVIMRRIINRRTRIVRVVMRIMLVPVRRRTPVVTIPVIATVILRTKYNGHTTDHRCTLHHHGRIAQLWQ